MFINHRMGPIRLCLTMLYEYLNEDVYAEGWKVRLA